MNFPSKIELGQFALYRVKKLVPEEERPCCWISKGESCELWYYDNKGWSFWSNSLLPKLSWPLVYRETPELAFRDSVLEAALVVRCHYDAEIARLQRECELKVVEVRGLLKEDE